MSKPRVIKWLFVLVSIWAILSSCNRNTPTTIDGFEAVEIKEGEYLSSNGNDGIDPREFIYMWRFQQSSVYVYHPEFTPLFQGDQKYWHTLIGTSYKEFSNYINSVRVGFRWNPDNELMELNAHWYASGARYTSSTLVTVELEQNFETSIKKVARDKVMVSITSESDNERGFEASEANYIIEFQRESLPITTRKISTYLGIIPAPHDMLFYRKQLN